MNREAEAQESLGKRLGNLPHDIQLAIYEKLNKKTRQQVGVASKEKHYILEPARKKMQENGVVPRVFRAYLQFVKTVILNLLPGESFVIGFRTRAQKYFDDKYIRIDDEEALPMQLIHLLVYKKDDNVFGIYKRDVDDKMFDFGSGSGREIDKFLGYLKAQLSLMNHSNRRLKGASISHGVIQMNREKLSPQRARDLGKLFANHLAKPLTSLLKTEPDAKLTTKVNKWYNQKNGRNLFTEDDREWFRQIKEKTIFQEAFSNTFIDLHISMNYMSTGMISPSVHPEEEDWNPDNMWYDYNFVLTERKQLSGSPLQIDFLIDDFKKHINPVTLRTASNKNVSSVIET